MKYQRGFTLIELMTVASIFTVVMTMVATMFISTTRNNNKVVFKQRIGAETRFALNLMAQEIRSGIINYAAYGGEIVGVQNTLYLIDPEGAEMEFSLTGDALMVARSDADSGNAHPVTSSDIVVRDLKFIISPGDDPQETLGVYDHPKVTIVWHAENNTAKDDERQAVDLQTTISSRRYR